MTVGKGTLVAASTIRLRPGSLVVFEGMDRSGKTTQATALRGLNWADPAPVFTHMPSGLTCLTEAVYRLTEDNPISSALARQLLHLACHAENMDALARARGRGGVVLDRWWWSTVAYGWFGGGLATAGMDEATFFGMIDTVWSDQPADVVFLFIASHEPDDLNRDAVRDGYSRLATRYPQLAVEVPLDNPGSTTDFLIGRLREGGLLQGA